MLMMRLQRVGRRNDPSYRVVVTDKRTGPKSNKHVALLGSYNPKLNHVQLDSEAVKKWLTQGVQPSPTVHNLLVSQGLLDAKKVNVLPKKTVQVTEEAEETETKEEAPAEEEEAKQEEERSEEVEDATVEAETEETTEAEAETKEEAPAEEEEAKVAS